MNRQVERRSLDIDALREQAHKELEIARLMGPSDDIEVGWVGYLEQLVNLTDEWIAFANTPATNAPHERDDWDDRLPESLYEMFSRGGNDACESLVQQIVADGFDGKLTRLTLDAAKEAAQKEVSQTYREVYDTEPDGRIAHEINERLCKPQEWDEYGRWTG
jgi:hypothetical protein